MATPRRRDNLNSRSNQVDQNFRKSLNSGRQLANVVGTIHGNLTSAAAAAGNVAEQIGNISKNARVAASAVGVGALVSLGIAMTSVWKEATNQMKDFNATMNRIGADTQIAQLRGISNAKDLEASRQAIINAGEQELLQLDKIKNAEERQLARAARFKQTREELAAFDRQVGRDRNNAYRTAFFAGDDTRRIQQARFDAARLPDIAGARRIRQEELAIQRDAELRDLATNQAGFMPEQIKRRREQITDAYDREMVLLEQDLQGMAFQVGDTFAVSLVDSISSGIETAIASGDIGKGIQAIGATAIGALGSTLQSYGVYALQAAKWLAAIQRWLFANPTAAIPAAIGLIALGGLMKGIGGKWSSDISGGIRGGSGGYASAGSGGRGGDSVIDRGLINPLNPLTGANFGIKATAPITLNATFFGTDDVRGQRQFLVWMDKALALRAG